jgi:hypothetical protein
MTIEIEVNDVTEETYVPFPTKHGKALIEGYMVPDTNRTIFVSEQRGMWVIAHLPSRTPMVSLGCIERLEALRVGKQFYAAAVAENLPINSKDLSTLAG